MAKKQYDVAVIGSGPGGYVAAIRCAQLGFRTVCIEKEKTLGGTCLNVGCIPSKALLQSTEYYDWVQKDAKEQGIEVKEIAYNFPQMMQRKSKIVDMSVKGVAGLFQKNQITWVEGAARLQSQHMVEVDNGTSKQVIEAENIILATGSEAIPLPFLPFDEKRVISSTGALALPAVPKKMLVIGAGVIGVELASVYNRLGSQVVIVEMLDRITPAMDQAISKMLMQVLKKQGLEFHLSAKVTKAQVKADAVELTFVEEEREVNMTADVVLVGVGRRPYTKGLGMAEVGIQMTSKGFVAVDGNFRTSVQNIYAIGDIVDGPMLAHRASEEGIAVAEILAGQRPHINYMTIPNVIYTHPEVAAVGLTEAEARDMGLEVQVGTCLFRANARARCAGYVEGIVKVIGDAKSGRLLGMHIMGAHASEMIGEGVLAMVKGATMEELANASHAHPTLTEAIKEAALNALGRAINF